VNFTDSEGEKTGKWGGSISARRTGEAEKRVCGRQGEAFSREMVLPTDSARKMGHPGGGRRNIAATIRKELAGQMRQDQGDDLSGT